MGLFGNKKDNQEVSPEQAENHALYLGACAILGGLMSSPRAAGLNTEKLINIAIRDAEAVMNAMFDETEEEPEVVSVADEKTS